MCCCKKETPKKYLFQDRLLTLDEEVDEPDNIKWENLDIGEFERFIRKLIVIFLAVLLILMSGIVLIALNTLRVDGSCDGDVEYTVD